MDDDDLARFAPDDSLLARIREHPSGMTSQERAFLLAHAAEELATAADLTLEEAVRMLVPFTAENRTTIQCGEQFAAVSAWGRLLYVTARPALRGVCHPDFN